MILSPSIRDGSRVQRMHDIILDQFNLSLKLTLIEEVISEVITPNPTPLIDENDHNYRVV